MNVIQLRKHMPSVALQQRTLLSALLLVALLLPVLRRQLQEQSFGLQSRLLSRVWLREG